MAQMEQAEVRVYDLYLSPCVKSHYAIGLLSQFVYARVDFLPYKVGHVQIIWITCPIFASD